MDRRRLAVLSAGFAHAAQNRTSIPWRQLGIGGRPPQSVAVGVWQVIPVSARPVYATPRPHGRCEIGPRRRPRISRRAPASRCRRQFVRSDELQPLATQQGAHLAGFLARVDGLENAQPIRGREAPPLDRRRHLRVRGTGRQRGCGVAASGRPPGSLHVVAGSRPPVALRAPSTPDPATTSISTASGMRVISPTSTAPTLTRIIHEGPESPPRTV